ncbi:cysteine-rich receptor-like protein kinase 10 [Chenopodium quinoa]|uniref:cysteine-rich receptor-like protein kinase 10 n=1 Tax=Chenopodium quinoa TaxID=63459 RepID=UPI000B789FA8|nr:cysteine-rich receptor-like protein kinase 10 [Chenopodium quinoa]
MAEKLVRVSLINLIFMISILMMISESNSAPNLLAQSCSNTTMFANNSQFGANLDTLFRLLTSNATNPTGFHQAISGGRNTTNEAVYGQFLCRGDLTISSCQDCVTTATTTDLPKIYCPNRKDAIIWYNECTVRYSNESFFGSLDTTPSRIDWSSLSITGNATRFMDLVSNMMNNDIGVRAATGGSQKKFATDFVNYTSFQTIYGMGQCTPDLSPGDCNTCLVAAAGGFRETQGGKVLQPSCFVRYEVYPFFNMVSLPSPSPSPSLSPQPQPPSLPTPNSYVSSGNKISTKAIIAIVVPIVAVTVALLIIAICCRTKYKKTKTYDSVAAETGDDFTTVESLQYDLATLQLATNNFSDAMKLGEGGFGGVYKGTLPNGQQLAVKRLSINSSQGIQEFKNEILLVAKLQHRNLVRILGFCFEGQEKLLVYEYVPNKSLDKFLHDYGSHGLIDWGTRYKIIGGIARGMLYLHHDSQLKIIHRDLKASNVLLDADMNAKISDFGMARIFVVDQSQDNTSRIVGTYGYMSPEYAMHGQFSNKSDVYSFGVLLLEIISGKRNSSFYESGEAMDLLSFAWKQWRDGMPLEFVDPTIRDSCSLDEVMRCIHLGLICVQESPDDRPSMATVVLTLDSYSVTLPVPEAPGFIIKSKVSKEMSKSAHWSRNDVSITELEPR